MTTTIIKKIGTAGAGRDYSTIQAFFDATPANLVTADEQWIGELYNDSELVCTTTQLLAARTTDATRNIILRTASGQGFADHANKATNALYYNTALGACVKGTLASMPLIQMNVDYSEIRGIQFKMTDTSATSILVMQAKNTVVIGNLLQTSTTAISAMGIDCGAGTGGSTITIENNVIVMLGGTSIGIHSNYAPGGTIANNTIYSSSANSRYGILLEATGPAVKNNAIFNITNVVSGGGTSVTNNATDQASISSGSGNIVSQTFSNHFVSPVDLRLKSTSALIGAGVVISGLTQDVLKQTFLSPPAVGAYEYYATAPTATMSWTEVNDTSAIATTVTITGVAGAVAYTEANDTSAITGTVTTVTGTITTGAFENNTGSVLASLTGLTVTVLNLATFAFVKTFTSKTTDASGIMTLNDALLVAGTQYAVVTANASGVLGVEKYTAT